MTETKTAFICPGQGSQSVGMLHDILAEYDVARQVFSEASKALGYDLADLVANGPAERLNSTEVTQPALLTASVAIWRVWQEKGGRVPDFLAGHSLGEYSALTIAGTFTLPDAVKLVRLRGELMQQAVPAGVGKMAAIIGLADDKILAACEQVAEGQVVSPVNYNSPGQVVIAGHADAVDRAMVACKEAGAKMAKALAVSVPSHCELMKPAADELAAAMAELPMQTPAIPVVNNVAASIETDVAAIREALVKQLYQPVLWTQVVQKLAGEGVETLYECGPGKVLCGLAKRIDKSLTAVPMQDLASINAALGE